MKIEIGSPIEYDGEMYFIDSIHKNRSHEGTSITIFIVDEEIQTMKAIQRAGAEKAQETLRKADTLMDKQDPILDEALKEIDEGKSEE